MAKIASQIHFKAKLFRPAGADKGAPWIFLNLPDQASQELPSRGMVSVEGTLNGKPFHVTLLPDGEGGHWLKADEKLQKQTGVKAGDMAEFEIAPMAEEPEPDVPDDVQKALEAAGPKALETWNDITAKARRDYIFWISSGKKEETRLKRIAVACDKLAKGNRRPCCFDTSGRFDKSLSCPLADEE